MAATATWGRNMKRLIVSMVIAAAAMASSASAATRYRVDAIGGLVVNPNQPNPIPGLTFQNGAAVIGSWVIDFGNATITDLSPLGGFGQARLFGGVVRQGTLIVSGSGINDFAALQNANSLGNIVAINDAGANPAQPNARLDQVTISDGARYSGGLITPYTVQYGLASDIFVRSLTFGRSQSGTNLAPPTLINSVNQPDFASLLSPTGAPYVFAFSLAQGSPANQAGIAALPFLNINATNVNVLVTQLAVPEPMTWTMIIVGFAIAGTGLRLRRPMRAPVAKAGL